VTLRARAIFVGVLLLMTSLQDHRQVGTHYRTAAVVLIV
jgi:hypothetical protein